jgi:hypothetical protein
VDLGAKYAKAMMAAFATDPLVLHVVQTANMTATGDKESVKIADSVTMDLSDRDMDIHMVTKAAGKTTKEDLVVVGTNVYARAGSDRWIQQPRSGWEQTISDVIRSLNPIRDPSHLGYVGVETIDKQKLQHLKAVRKFPYILGDGQTGTWESFDIWVQEDGTPVLAKGRISAIGAYGIEIKGTSEMRFSKFGGTIEIAAPKT